MPDYAFLDTSRLRFAYLAEGEGPLVVLLHGFPDTARGYDVIRPRVARAGFRAFTPNLRGYAPTEIPKDAKYDAETLAADVIAMLDALDAPRAILVGHDWGASIAYSVATIAPERIRTLVTIGIPHPAAVKPSLKLVYDARHILYFQSPFALSGTRANDFAYVDALYRRWSPTWNPSPEETADVKAAFREPGCLEAAIGYYRAIGVRPPASQKPPIRVPTFTFAGTDDPVITIEGYHAAAKCFDAPYRVVPCPGGHFLHREHPEEFLAELLPILAAAPP